jgi:hypothetical protein
MSCFASNNNKLMADCIDQQLIEKSFDDVFPLLQDLSTVPPMKSIPEVNETSVEMSPYIYHLVAVIRHQGNDCRSGHYIADVIGPLGSDWYRCNDCTIEKIRQVLLLFPFDPLYSDRLHRKLCFTTLNLAHLIYFFTKEYRSSVTE